MSRHFDGTSANYLEATSIPFTLTYPFTMACWFKPATAVDIGALMCMGGSVSPDYVELGAHSNGTLFSDRYNGTSGIEGTGFSASSVQVVGTWVHAGLVCTSATSAIVYANGTAGTANTDNVAIVSSRYDRTNVGCATTANTRGQFANGDIAYPTLWSAALTGTEMTALAAGTHPLDIQNASVAAFWRLTGSASPELDTSPVGTHPLTVVGSSAGADDPVVNAPSGAAPPVFIQRIGGASYAVQRAATI